MNFKELKALLDSIDPEQLQGGNSAAAKAEGYYRYHVLMLLGAIAGSQDSLSATYRNMLDLQKQKCNPQPNPPQK